MFDILVSINKFCENWFLPTIVISSKTYQSEDNGKVYNRFSSFDC